MSSSGERDSISVFDYRCTASPHTRPFAEWHGGYSVSYVRKGTFGYRVRGRSFDLVAGSTLVGRAGDEYLCTHDHVCGDECLAFRLPLEMIDSMTGERLWQ